MLYKELPRAVEKYSLKKNRPPHKKYTEKKIINKNIIKNQLN